MISIDLDQFEYICKTERPKAVMLVSVLGLVPDIQRVIDICEKHDVCLIEDTCESFGSRYSGKKLGPSPIHYRRRHNSN